MNKMYIIEEWWISGRIQDLLFLRTFFVYDLGTLKNLYQVYINLTEILNFFKLIELINLLKIKYSYKIFHFQS